MVAVAAIITGTDSKSVESLRHALSEQVVQPQLVLEAETLQQGIENLTENADFDQTGWVWVLDDSVLPAEDALQQLLAVVEKSPSVAWVAPKIFKNLGQSRALASFGQTVNRLWAPVALAEQQLDQAQHDHREELLSANRLGSLIRLDVLAQHARQLEAHTLTADYRLAIDMRLGGQRLVGAPLAKVSLEGKPLAASISDASRFGALKTQIGLLTSYQPWAIALLLGLLAPVLSVLSLVWNLLRKSPERILGDFAAGIWWFVMTPALLARRPHFGLQSLRQSARAVLRSLPALFATDEDLHRARYSRVDQPAAVSEAEQNVVDQPRFAASGGVWLMLLLAVASYQFWPSAAAAVGGSLLPLGTSLKQIFSSAGASWQQVGFGLAAPSDPINWVYFLLAAVTFWQPNLGVAVLIFLAKPLAFASAWRLLSLTSKRPWLLATGALAYAFWPALNTAQLQGRFGVVLESVLLPIFVFAIARILRFGASERRSVQTWTWVGLGGLLAAAISAAAPSLTPLVAALIFFLAVYRFKRIGYIMWLPVPLIVLWFPMAYYIAVGLGHPMALLTEPGVPVASAQQPLWQLLLGGSAVGPFASLSPWLLALPLAIGAGATLTRRTWNALWLWLAFLAAVLGAWAFNCVQFYQHNLFARLAPERVSAGSPLALLTLAGLVAALLLVLSLDAIKSRSAGLLGALSVAVSLALGLQFALAQSVVKFTDGTTVPALVAAQAESNQQTRTLVINPLDAVSGVQPVIVTLVTGAGSTASQVSTAYAAALPSLTLQNKQYSKLAQLAANLIASNGSNLKAGLRRYQIDFVLVQNGPYAAQTGASLDTVVELEPVGYTTFGRLWRVSAASFARHKTDWQWSLTKEIQTATFALYGLLAIPTKSRRRSKDLAGGLDAFATDSDGDGY